MKKIIANCFLFLCTSSLFASHLIFDEHVSPISSSENIVSIQNQCFKMQDKVRDQRRDWILKSYKEGTNPLIHRTLHEMIREGSASKYGVICYSKIFLRMMEKALIWTPVNCLTMVLQHEVFGHGYRMRELGKSKFTVHDYRISLKGGSTTFSVGPKVTPSDYLSAIIAGSEANSLLANTLEKSWIESGTIDGRQSSLWQLSRFDLFLYVASTRKYKLADFRSQSGTGHDICTYLVYLSKLYGSENFEESYAKDLLHRSKMSLWLNPFTYLSVLANLSHTLLNSSIPVPGLSLGRLKFLPSYQLGLTPFGPENIYRGYLWNSQTPLTTFYIREGRFSRNQYIGLGVENQSLIRTAFGHFGARLDIWNQPKLTQRAFASETENPSMEKWLDEMGDQRKELWKKKAGASASLFYKYPFAKSWNSHVWMQVGYKTSGYIPGESLKQNLIARMGLQFGF